MKFSRSIVSFAFLATLGCAGAAFAHGAPQSASDEAPSFDEVAKGKSALGRSDLPKDVPALKELRAHINEADTNHNGRIEKDEYDAYVNKSKQRPQNQN